MTSPAPEAVEPTTYGLMARFTTAGSLREGLDALQVATGVARALFPVDTVVQVEELAVHRIEGLCPECQSAALEPGPSYADHGYEEGHDEPCPIHDHDHTEGDEVPEGYLRPLEIREGLHQAMREELVRHRQDHDPRTGASVCACGQWEGPFTLQGLSGEGSYAQHLTQALDPIVGLAGGQAWATGYYDGAKDKQDEYDLYLGHTEFPSEEQPADPGNVLLYVRALEETLRSIRPRTRLTDRLFGHGAMLVFGVRHWLGEVAQEYRDIRAEMEEPVG